MMKSPFSNKVSTRSTSFIESVNLVRSTKLVSFTHLCRWTMCNKQSKLKKHMKEFEFVSNLLMCSVAMNCVLNLLNKLTRSNGISN